MLLKLFILSVVVFFLGVWIAMLKPKPGKESLDWVGGFISGAAIILGLASGSALLTQ